MDNEIIKCNLCGEVMDDFDIIFDFKASKVVGYGSIHDGERLNLRLCSACLDRLTEACAISPYTETD